MAGISIVAKKIGIDLGTANIVVWIEGQGIVYREPAIVARDIHNGEILAVGNEAFRILDQQPGNVVSSRPLKEGVIADYETTVAMIANIIKKSAKYSFQKPYLMIGTPLDITEVEKRAVVEAAIEAGAKEAFLLDEPFAAAIGAGLPITLPTGNFIVDIGGGTTNIAVLSLGGVVASHTISIAGDNFDEEIKAHIARKYEVAISPRTAEMLKIKSGSADLGQSVYYDKQPIKARDLKSGLPKTVTIEPQVISAAIQSALNQIIVAIGSVLEQLPPEIGADIISHGIVLTGGGALLKDIAKVFSKKIAIPVAVAAEPLDCVVTGIGENLKNIQQIRKRNTKQ